MGIDVTIFKPPENLKILFKSMRSVMGYSAQANLCQKCTQSMFLQRYKYKARGRIYVL